jgi:alkylhydroperoxidase family enzyme
MAVRSASPTISTGRGGSGSLRPRSISERERAALAWAERLTMMAGPESSSSTEPPTALFDQAEILRLAVVIATINAWNRIAGGLHFPPSARAA